MTEHNLLVFLVQVLVLLALARGAGELLRRLGQAPIVGEILVGVLLGPTLLGRAFPELHASLFPPDAVQRSMLDVVSWFGVLFLLLETGLHVDVSAAWRARGPALRIGIIGVLVPLLVGSALSFLLPDRVLADPDRRIIFALFLGTTMAISAMVIIARVLHDLDLVKSDLGLVTLCGYAVNDILAWIVFSLVLAVATSAALNLGSIAFLLIFTFAFTAFSLTFGLRLVDRAVARIGTRMTENPGAVLTFVCCLGLACGALTQWVGLTALFGFFLAGIMAGEARHLTERTREIIGQMVHSIFVPLYFAGLALHLDFIANFDIGLVAFVTVVSIATKFLGAWLGALGRDFSAQDRVSIGIAFTPSGVTGIVVAGVALEYRSSPRRSSWLSCAPRLSPRCWWRRGCPGRSGGANRSIWGVFWRRTPSCRHCAPATGSPPSGSCAASRRRPRASRPTRSPRRSISASNSWAPASARASPCRTPASRSCAGR